MTAYLAKKPRYRSSFSYVGLLLPLALAGGSSTNPPQQHEQLKASQRATVPLEGSVYIMAFTADGKSLASVSIPPSATRPGAVKVWDGTTGRELATLPGTKDVVDSLAFSEDGKTLATGGPASADPYDQGRWEGVVKLWEVASGKERARFKDYAGRIVFLKFSPDGRILASASQGTKGEGRLKLWDMSTGRVLAAIPGGTYGKSVLEFAPDSKTLAWATLGFFPQQKQRWEPELKLINIATGKELANLKGHTHEIMCLAFSPDGKTLASGGGGAARAAGT
jgi:WD40 repeat protein